MGLNIALLTVSDTRTRANDESGKYLAAALGKAGHQLLHRDLVKDDKYQIRARIAAWIADPAVQVLLITGGTGFSDRDVTPEAVQPLLDREIPGFGELFRQLSHEEIGNSTLQSRALGGLANRTCVFCLPGSPGACRTAWEELLLQQLNINHKPCNFAELVADA